MAVQPLLLRRLGWLDIRAVCSRAHGWYSFWRWVWIWLLGLFFAKYIKVQIILKLLRLLSSIKMNLGNATQKNIEILAIKVSWWLQLHFAAFWEKFLLYYYLGKTPFQYNFRNQSKKAKLVENSQTINPLHIS